MGRYSTPIAGILARLNYQADTNFEDRLLSGVKIIAAPVKETKGMIDVPCVMLFLPDFQENFAPARNIDGKMEIKIWVMAARDVELVGAYALAERVLDALQRDPASGLAAAIPGTARHCDGKLEGAYAKSKFFHLPITLYLQPFKHEVGFRADKVVPPPAPPVPLQIPIEDVFGDDIQGVGGEGIGGVTT